MPSLRVADGGVHRDRRDGIVGARPTDTALFARPTLLDEREPAAAVADPVLGRGRRRYGARRAICVRYEGTPESTPLTTSNHLVVVRDSGDLVGVVTLEDVLHRLFPWPQPSPSLGG
jgi:CBS domain-containing protein